MCIQGRLFKYSCIEKSIKCIVIEKNDPDTSKTTLCIVIWFILGMSLLSDW